MKIDFFTVDVFTTQQFGGNPLAVVPKAQELEGEQMQKIAMEFNLAETAFVLPPDDATHTARVRIFTPRSELPFAGHPNVGTAFVLASRSEGRAAGPLVFEEKAGLVKMDLIEEGRKVVGARLAAPQKLTHGEEVSSDVVASACSISPRDIETARHPPRLASCGIPFVMVELKSREALRAAAPRSDVFARELPPSRATGIHLYVPVREDGVDIQARMFAPLLGVPEDPATGSANVALVGLLASLEPGGDGRVSRSIAQGVDMGRPSLMHAEAVKRGGEVQGTWIGGRCVAMMEGRLDLRG